MGDGSDADLSALIERDRAALRAYLGALAEAVRCGLELERLCDLLPLEERGHQVAEIYERLEHTHELVGALRRR